jgi:hypothetical protein
MTSRLLPSHGLNLKPPADRLFNVLAVLLSSIICDYFQDNNVVDNLAIPSYGKWESSSGLKRDKLRHATCYEIPA